MLEKNLSIDKKSLPRKLEVSHLIAGECDISEELTSLLLAIVTDNDIRRLDSEHCM